MPCAGMGVSFPVISSVISTVTFRPIGGVGPPAASWNDDDIESAGADRSGARRNQRALGPSSLTVVAALHPVLDRRAVSPG